MTSPAAILEETLRYNQAPAADTAELENHTHDELCVMISDRIHVILESFKKYQHIPYVVQGPRDYGVDVLLKGGDADEPEKYVALQVKSFKEIAEKENDLSKQLKAGYFDARAKYGDGLQRYYILLFGHAEKHFKRISAISNEFAKTPDVRVIGPRHLLTFIDMRISKLAAIVDRQLSEDDFVRRQAHAEVHGLEPHDLYFILACLCWVFENSDDQLPDDFFATNGRMATLIEEYGFKALEKALARFQDSALEEYATPHSIRVRAEMYSAIRALYFDIQVRYNEDADELFDHLFEFLTI